MNGLNCGKVSVFKYWWNGGIKEGNQLYLFLFISLFYLLWSLVFAWMNDPWIESYLSINRIEQYSMIIGIKLTSFQLLVVKEFLLFNVFW